MPKPRESSCCGRWTLFKSHLQLHTSLLRILVMFSFSSVGQVLIWNSKDRDNFLLIWKINWERQSGENKKTTLLWCLWKLTQHLCLDLLLQTGAKEEAERRQKMYKSNFKNMFVSDPKGWRHQKEGDSFWSLPGDWWKQSILTQGKHLDLISGNLKLSKLNQTPAVFVILLPSPPSPQISDSQEKPTRTKKRRAQPAAGVPLVKGMESSLQLVDFYTLLPNISMPLTHWTA